MYDRRGLRMMAALLMSGALPLAGGTESPMEQPEPTRLPLPYLPPPKREPAPPPPPTPEQIKAQAKRERKAARYARETTNDE